MLEFICWSWKCLCMCCGNAYVCVVEMLNTAIVCHGAIDAVLL